MSNAPKISAGERVRYKPQIYMPQMSIFWWVKDRVYVFFIIRELTSLVVAAYVILMMIQINALSQGPEAWQALTDWFATPFSIGLHIVFLILLIFHTLTWFWVAPTAMVVRIGSKKVPGSILIAGNIAMWLIISLAIGWLIVSI